IVIFADMLSHSVATGWASPVWFSVKSPRDLALVVLAPHALLLLVPAPDAGGVVAELDPRLRVGVILRLAALAQALALVDAGHRVAVAHRSCSFRVVAGGASAGRGVCYHWWVAMSCMKLTVSAAAS